MGEDIDVSTEDDGSDDLQAGAAALWLLLRRRPDPIAIDDLGCVDITGQAIEEPADIDGAVARPIELHEGIGGGE